MQVRNEVKELRLLFEVLQILDSASDLSDNLETVLEVMAEHTGMMRGVITLLDEAHGEIAIEAAYGMSAEAQSKGRYKLGEGITGKVIESGKPLVIPNVLVEPLFLNRTGSRSRKEAVSFICVPVKMEGRVIGALSADRLFAASEALEEDMRLLSVLASLISKAVKNRQERHRMLEENRRLLDVLRERSRPEMFVGRSPGLRAVLTQLAQVAPTSATVLLLGESGTGKELAANTIHAGSPRPHACGNVGRHRQSFAQGLRRHHDRLFNLYIAGAATNVAAQRFLDPGGGRLGVLVKQSLSADHHPRRTESALYCTGFGKRPGIHFFFPLRQTFHRNHRLVLQPAERQQTGPHRQPVDQHHTSAAGSFAAAVLHRSQPQGFPQIFQQVLVFRFLVYDAIYRELVHTASSLCCRFFLAR